MKQAAQRMEKYRNSQMKTINEEIQFLGEIQRRKREKHKTHKPTLEEIENM